MALRRNKAFPRLEAEEENLINVYKTLRRGGAAGAAHATLPPSKVWTQETLTKVIV